MNGPSFDSFAGNATSGYGRMNGAYGGYSVVGCGGLSACSGGAHAYGYGQRCSEAPTTAYGRYDSPYFAGVWGGRGGYENAYASNAAHGYEYGGLNYQNANVGACSGGPAPVGCGEWVPDGTTAQGTTMVSGPAPPMVVPAGTLPAATIINSTPCSPFGVTGTSAYVLPPIPAGQVSGNTCGSYTAMPLREAGGFQQPSSCTSAPQQQLGYMLTPEEFQEFTEFKRQRRSYEKLPVVPDSGLYKPNGCF